MVACLMLQATTTPFLPCVLRTLLLVFTISNHLSSSHLNSLPRNLIMICQTCQSMFHGNFEVYASCSTEGNHIVLNNHHGGDLGGLQRSAIQGCKLCSKLLHAIFNSYGLYGLPQDLSPEIILTIGKAEKEEEMEPFEKAQSITYAVRVNWQTGYNNTTIKPSFLEIDEQALPYQRYRRKIPRIDFRKSGKAGSRPVFWGRIGL